jgi:phosphate uptake regulator
MFKKLMAAWRGKTFLNKIVKNFEQMLILGEEIFKNACSVWQGEVSSEKVRDSIYSVDLKINKAEQGIRRRLVEHLAVEPEVDVAACLVFMSIVKDAERIGDYSKNIFGVALLREGGFEEDEWTKALKEIQEGVVEMFVQTRDAFAKATPEAAKPVMEKHHKISLKCEELMRKMAKGEISSNKAVCYTLFARYLKRVSCHLANIASAIVNPVEKIDFVGEGLL